MNHFENLLEKLVSWMIILSLAGIFFFVTMQVAFRFLFQSPLPWPEELSRILFGYLVFIGGAEASMERSHISIDIVDTLFRNPKHKICADIFRSLLVLLALCVMFYGAWQIIPATSSMALPATGFSMALMVVPVLVGSLLMALWLIFHIIRDIQSLRAPSNG